jgi:hypothetical protein
VDEVTVLIVEDNPDLLGIVIKQRSQMPRHGVY